MNIEVRLFAYFRENRGKKQFLELEDGATLKTVLDLLEIPENDVSILLLNGIDGPSTRKLSENDVIALFPPVGGG